MQRSNLSAGAWIAILALLGGQALAATPATPAVNSAYRSECGSCHLAYPARLLSTREWGIVLGRLEQHYGVDASLDDATLRQVAGQLDAPVSPALGDSGTLPRITAKAWFVDEHDDVTPRTFRGPDVRTAANCPACHVGAERGDFDEHAVRVPGGQRHD